MSNNQEQECRKIELQLKGCTLETASQLMDISERLAQAVKEDNFTAVCEAVHDIQGAYDELASYVMAFEEIIEEASKE